MGDSPHGHGRSEVYDRPALVRAIKKERRRLGLRARALREKRKLTQEAAAELIGIHAKHVVRIESGGANVTIATLVAMASAYRVALVDLFVD